MTDLRSVPKHTASATDCQKCHDTVERVAFGLSTPREAYEYLVRIDFL